MFASSAVYRNDSFAKLVGSDFFNTLSHNRTLRHFNAGQRHSVGTGVDIRAAGIYVATPSSFKNHPMSGRG